MGKLTPKQERFVQLYLIEPNATKAYQIAYGVSEQQANKSGPRLLVNVGIAQEIKERQEKRAAKMDLTAEKVLKELSKIAFFDPRKLFDEEGRPKPIHELDDDTVGAIAGLDVLEEYNGTGKDREFVGYVKKYKVSDKNSALQAAMKHLGIAGTEKHEHDFTGLTDSERAERIAAILEAARSRRT